MPQFQATICTIYTQLLSVALPAALIGILVAVIGFLLIPVLGDTVAASRGYIRTALFTVAILGILPGFISALASMSGFAGGSCT